MMADRRRMIGRWTVDGLVICVIQHYGRRIGSCVCMSASVVVAMVQIIGRGPRAGSSVKKKTVVKCLR